MNWVHKEIQTFGVALTFYTRIPFPKKLDDSLENQKRSIIYFPVIGWIVGGIGALIYAIGSIIFPDSIALILSMVATILVTGALHEDGFADFCDGFGGGTSKEQILRIMKDSSIGTYGVLGLVLLLGLKFTTINAFPGNNIVALVIIGHSASRFTTSTLLFSYDYVEGQTKSKAKTLVKRLSGLELLIVACLGSIPFLLFLDPLYLISLIPLLLLSQFLGMYFKKRIGGYTGDCLGATQQITEVAFYLTILIVS